MPYSKGVRARFCPPEQMGKLFQEFSQADASTRHADAGISDHDRDPVAAVLLPLPRSDGRCCRAR
jgi:hypothetical protein